MPSGWRRQATQPHPDEAREVARAGGFNFDAKLRRQSIDPVDLFHAHVGGMDTLAEALVRAAGWIEDGRLQGFVKERCQGWDDGLGREILAGKVTLDELWRRARVHGVEPKPRSGRQEQLENLLRRRPRR